MLKTMRLSFKLLWRELIAGEWIIVFLAVMLAVAATTSLKFFATRLNSGLAEQARNILGGDIVISSTIPISPEVINEAKVNHLSTKQVWEYPTMMSAGEKMQLVTLQAVSAEAKDSVPESGMMWVESRILNSLQLNLNSVVTVGVATFRLQNTISPLAGGMSRGWLFAPRVIINLQDVPKTQTVISGSRIDYRLMLSGSDDAVEQYKNWLKPKLQIGQKIITPNDQLSVLNNIWGNVENYLQLSLLIGLIITAAALVLSMHQYLKRHYATVALLRCLGARKNQIIKIYMIQLVTVAILAATVGVIIGYYAQSLFTHLLSSIMQFTLPSTGIEPVVIGLITGLVLTFSFSYPIISQLPTTPPSYIWRDEFSIRSRYQVFYFFAAIAVSFSLIFYLIHFSLLVLLMLDALIITTGFTYGLSLLLLSYLKKLKPLLHGASKQGVSQLIQYSGSVTLQITIFTIISMLLIVMWGVQHGIVEKWHSSLSPSTPNYFAINISPKDVPNVKSFLQDNHVTLENIYPMVKGRLIALNDKPIMIAIPTTGRGHNALYRELNLSWMWKYPSDNKVVSGDEWHSANKNQNLISVEKGLADDLGFKLGDKLSFRVGDRTISGVVGNLRTLSWVSFHPNFYVIFTPGMLEGYPATYIMSFYLVPQQAQILNQLVRLYPNMTIIDVADIVKQLQSLAGKLSMGVQYLYLLCLLVGVLIFIVCLQGSMQERRQTTQLLRVLGAANQYISRATWVEFGVLGLLIVSLSFAFAQGIVYLVMRHYF